VSARPIWSCGGESRRASWVTTIPIASSIDRSSEPPTHGNENSTRYRIDREIAQGGMGAILKARDPDLGRDVAMKVLLARHSDNDDMVRRFVEEAQTGGQLQHPGVVPIYELGTFADRLPFFSMKLVKDKTLADLLAARPTPADDLPRFLSIFAAMAQTMAYPYQLAVRPTSVDLCWTALSRAANKSSSRVYSLLSEGSSPSSENQPTLKAAPTFSMRATLI
jgi:serine/threonine protein kinase